MSYILRNLTRGDLILANNTLIKQNGCVIVDEITDQLNEEKTRGLISIVEEVDVNIVIQKPIEKIEVTIKQVEPVIKPVEEPKIIEEPVEKKVEEPIEETPEIVEETKEEVSIENQSSQKPSTNYSNYNNNKKFKKN